MVRNTLPPQDGSTDQIWDSYLQEYRRYAPDSMPILETRSEITVSPQGWNATHCHPKMHILNLGFLPQMIEEKCSGHEYSKN